ncbi:Cro/CI family transcriptional regulator [Shewanella sp. SW36]|uniref:Cro/CI family transcriptional regulator n=1 Tax=unclassified Shewanella TaxID=196818 RepID=UPI0021DB18FD|nr:MULTISPECIES: Cro/CI family transcriptional regulator [unclassified Shewanella]MCU7976123.1 Cro/CI family transcriptional regulator [Shewanella sp. SW36]MCU7988926.1 Cro/CI family transcriptional regulator [Shewanella sp. SW1]MCU8050602.1 Cro/CI family transcriptional regulator [Shewanella sp. SM43]
MKKTDVLNFFGGTAATAAALNIKSPSVSGWGEDVPELRAYQIERLTHGALKVNPVVVLDNPESASVA